MAGKNLFAEFQQFAARIDAFIDKKFATKDAIIEDLHRQLAAKDSAFEDLQSQVDTKDALILDLQHQVAAKDVLISDLKFRDATKNAFISDLYEEVATQHTVIAARDSVIKIRDKMIQKLKSFKDKIFAEKDAAIAANQDIIAKQAKELKVLTRNCKNLRTDLQTYTLAHGESKKLLTACKGELRILKFVNRIEDPEETEEKVNLFPHDFRILKAYFRKFSNKPPRKPSRKSSSIAVVNESPSESSHSVSPLPTIADLPNQPDASPTSTSTVAMQSFKGEPAVAFFIPVTPIGDKKKPYRH